MQGLAVGNALDGDDLGAFRLNAEDAAGVHDAAVHEDAAGAAVAVVAAFLGAGQAKLVAQDFEQALAGARRGSRSPRR